MQYAHGKVTSVRDKVAVSPEAIKKSANHSLILKIANAIHSYSYHQVQGGDIIFLGFNIQTTQNIMQSLLWKKASFYFFVENKRNYKPYVHNISIET